MRIAEIIDTFRDQIENATTEAPIQAFLEKYPFLIAMSPHEVEGNAVISQFPLGANFRADFAYIYSTSSGTFLNLIEIERPNIQMFLDNDEFSQSYNHAFQQLQDWKAWCEINQEYLRYILGPFYSSLKRRSVPSYFYPKCKLLAGRRSQLSNLRREERYSAKVNQLPSRFLIMTYDGLLEGLGFLRSSASEYLQEIKCVTYKNHGYFEKHAQD